MERSNNLLATISNQALQDGTLTQAELEQIQHRLWLLLGHRVGQYTDSSSLPTETAEELMKSICFSLGFYLQSVGNTALLNTEPMEALLAAAWRTLEAAMGEGKRLLRQAEETAPLMKNRAYRDTLRELHVFFQRYDMRFFAHLVPCSIDYQLCRPVPEQQQGIEYVCTYLRRLLLENAFCCRFEPKVAVSVLERYCPDYEGLLINLYELLATNAIGCAILGTSIPPLFIGAEGQNKLLERLKNQPLEAVVRHLEEGAIRVCKALYLQEEEGAYLRETAQNMARRVHIAAENGRLDGIFRSDGPRSDGPCVW